jgi:hypothetical protein
VQGIRSAKLELVRFIADDFTAYDPMKPDSIKTFAMPASPNFTNQRPLGD